MCWKASKYKGGSVLVYWDTKYLNYVSWLCYGRMRIYEHYPLPEDGMTMNIFVHINALSILNVLRKKDKLPKLSYLIAFIYVI